MCTRPFVLMALILSLLAGGALATDIPDLSNCYATMPEGPLPRFLMVVPDGSGPPLSEARITGGAIHSAVISLWVIDNQGTPIFHYPAEDIWLAPSCESASFCGFAHPDGPTDENGMTTFTGPYPAGGHLPEGCGVEVLIAAMVVPGGPLPLRLLGPDITGDLHVNLSDIALLVQALDGYAWEADFNVDGVVNLSDIVFMAPAIGAVCP